MYEHCNALEVADSEALSLSGFEQAKAFRENVLPAMELLRADVDGAERITAEDCWPVSTYGELMFKI